MLTIFIENEKKFVRNSIFSSEDFLSHGEDAQMVARGKYLSRHYGAWPERSGELQ
ncbi:hypothetical protein ES703_10569 [subsurface metagenome]